MRQLFEITVVLLFAIVTLEAFVLQEIIMRTAQVKRLYRRPNRTEPQQLQQGSPAPEFTANVLGVSRSLRTSDLRGHSTILLFVSPNDAATRTIEELSVGTHALWHKAHGHLYLICGGGEEACHELVQHYAAQGIHVGHIPVILDENGLIAERFSIGSTPLAVMLDDQVRVSRYGHLLPNIEVANGAQ